MLLTPNKAGSDSDLSKKQSSSHVTIRNKRKNEDVSKDDFNAFKQEIKEMLTSWKTDHDIILEAMDGRLNKMETTLSSLQKTNCDIEKSLDFIAHQYEDMQHKIDSLEKQCKNNQSCISSLEEKVEELQRNIRKTSIEIYNLPTTEKENQADLGQKILTLSKSLNLGLNANDVRNVTRVPGKKGTNRSVVVEFANESIKQAILASVKSYNKSNPSKKLNGSHFGACGNSPVYIREHLTNNNKRLFYLARELSKQKSFQFCWTSNGRVFLRKVEGQPSIIIKNEAQILDLKNE
ncbi:uncharacterized protein LOC142984742 [Anticarsia gemmatalis]|uniref:uncharacterized protein LOC142984742 n=1 Tax=Anticarsia gemmatalis TaxID=129554 RepID=UPI003F7598B4